MIRLLEKIRLLVYNAHLAGQGVEDGFPGDLAEKYANKVMKTLTEQINADEPTTPVAYEFHNLKTGHCYVDYIRRTDIEQVGDGEYVQKPLFYCKPK